MSALLKVNTKEKIFNRLEQLKDQAKKLEFSDSDLALIDELIVDSKTEDELIEVGKFLSASVNRAKDFFFQAL